MGFDLTDTDEEVEASAWASLIAPLLRQKSICALKAELSICSVFEQIGHVWDSVSLSGFDFSFEADAGFEWDSGFTDDLGFDEEDEDFLDPGMPSASGDLSRATDVEVSTPSTGIEPLPEDQDEDGPWAGWETQDKEAVEEVEQFDNIGVGFMDEEWMERRR